MNTTTRRIATTLVGVGLAASAVATAGPAVAAKPGGGGTTVQPLNIYGDNVYPVDGTPYMSISYQVPSRAQKVTCSLDGVALSACADNGAGYYIKSGGYTTFYKNFPQVEGAAAEHTFAVTVVAKTGTYSGSWTFALAI
jgi:hypothetical protein